MKEEVWKPVVGYEGLYEISDMGNVKRLAHVTVDTLGRTMPYKEIVLSPCISRQTGYPYVGLSKDGKTKTFNIHTLIADAFIPNPLNLPCVNHIDENRANSVLSNLERCDYSYNNSYGNANRKRKDTLRKNLAGKHKPIFQFTLDGKLIKKFTCGVAQLKETLGYDMGDCLAGKSKTAHGFVFSYCPVYNYKEDIPKRHQKWVMKIDDNGKEIEKYKSVSEAASKNGFDRHCLSKTKPIDGVVTINGIRFVVEQKENEYIPKGHKGSRPDLKGKCAKAVSQYTKEGVYIRDFDSIVDAAVFMGNKSYGPEITNCCNGKLKTARGYLWRHKGDPAPMPFRNNNLRKINQFTIDGSYVNTFNSIAEAASVVGNNHPGSIQNCLSGISKSAHGYKWKYKTD